MHPDEDYFNEMEFLGFPVSSSPFELLQTDFRGPLATELFKYAGREVKLTGRYVCHKRLSTSKAGPMAFGTFLDHEQNFFDTVNFPNSYKTYPFTGQGIYLILGEVSMDFDCPAILVKMARLPIRHDPRFIS